YYYRNKSPKLNTEKVSPSPKLNTEKVSPSPKQSLEKVSPSTKQTLEKTSPTSPKKTLEKTSPISPNKTSEKVSPCPSLSSASIPSPSSTSPASISPEVPRKRINPNFDKAKEKFAGGGLLDMASPAAPAADKNSIRRSASPSVGLIKDRAKEFETPKQKRVINVPISAPWYQRSLSTTQAPETGRAHR
ncbi:hypothetical protein OESDEN_21276, partial [Oesophagostomum dentatum]